MAGAGAVLKIQSSPNSRHHYGLKVNQFQKHKLSDEDIIVSVLIPYGTPRTTLKCYKAAARHRNAHAAVNASFRVVLDDDMVYTVVFVLLYGEASEVVDI